MKSNEEILEQAHPNKSYMTPPNATYATVYKAMDEARRESAVGFARFIDSGAFECILHTDDDEKIWQEYGEGKNYTTSELYNLYLKNKEK